MKEYWVRFILIFILNSFSFWDISADASLDAFRTSLTKSAGLYQNKEIPKLNSTVLIVSCNFATLDILLNWVCHAQRFHLKFLVFAMDSMLLQELSQSPYDQLIPYVYHGKPSNLNNHNSIQISPNATNRFREGQFNLIGAFKLSVVRDALFLGFNVIFSDVDVLFLSDPIQALFPIQKDDLIYNDKLHTYHSIAGVLQPIADFAYQQNLCLMKNLWKHLSGNKREGNTGFYFMRSTSATIAFLDSAVEKCWNSPLLDDQTNTFAVFYEKEWNNHIKRCLFSETPSHPIGLSSWPLSKDIEINNENIKSFSACQLPLLTFPAGIAAINNKQWQMELEKAKVSQVVMHFNCFNGHVHKVGSMKNLNLWNWNADTKECTA